MQILIEIPEEDYERLKVYKKAPFCSFPSRIYEAIANGTPLPEHHGRLIDADVACPNHTECVMCPVAIECPICAAPTIIPATKEKQTERKCESCKYHDGRGGCLDSCALCRYTPKLTATKEGAK